VLKISEVYEKQCRSVTEKPDGTEQIGYGTQYFSRECLINENYIVAVHPHEFRSELTEQKMAESFPEGTKFSTLVVDGNSFRKSEILVIGSFEKFRKILENKSA
tara:strand:- start:219 stop:530 length:312 start_codon:yes stop_codon:yes gene_type:complete